MKRRGDAVAWVWVTRYLTVSDALWWRFHISLSDASQQRRPMSLSDAICSCLIMALFMNGHLSPFLWRSFQPGNTSEKKYSFFVFPSKLKNGLKPLKQFVFWLRTRNSTITFSKSALTDMWIHFFEIFLRQKVSARKNTAFFIGLRGAVTPSLSRVHQPFFSPRWHPRVSLKRV